MSPADASYDLTVAIPFHRGLAYLKQAVESVREQTDPHWRLVVCDDAGGEEGVREYLDGLGDERICYRRNEQNLGMVPNWNRQFEMAETDLLTLLHQDDRLLPNYVELMRSLAREYADVCAIYCATKIIDEDGRECFSFADWIKRFLAPRSGRLTELEGKTAVRALLGGNFIMCPTLCYRRSSIGDRRFDTRWEQVQDLEFTTRLLMDGERLLGVRERGYAYRRHATSATSVQSESLLRFEEECELYDLVAQRCDERGWTDAAATGRRKRILKLHLGFRIAGDLLHVRFARAATKWRFLLAMR